MMSVPGKSPRENHPYQNYSWVQLHEVIIDKEYQLECLRDELRKLGNIESESRRKDEVIAILRRELVEYKKAMQVHDARNDTVDDQLTQCESLLNQRTQELEKLKKETEEKLKSISSKSNVSQKEVQSLLEVKALLEAEVKELRINRDQDRDTISVLRKQLIEKKNRTGSLQDQNKKLQTNYQDLQTTLALVQAEHSKLQESEQHLKAEVKRLKALNSEGLRIQQKCDFMEKQLDASKKNENDMAVAIGRLESELSQLCDHIANCTQTHAGRNPTSPKAAVDLVTKLTNSYGEATGMVASLQQEQEEDQECISKLKADVTHLLQLWKTLQEELDSDSNGALDLLCSRLGESQSLDERMNELYDTMKKSIEILSNLEDQCKKELSSVCDHIKDCYTNLKDLPEAKTAGDMVTNMAAAAVTLEKEIKQLNNKISESELEHTASLSGAITALRQDEQQRITEVADKVKQDEEVKKIAELQKQMETLDLQKQEAVLKEKETSQSLIDELQVTKNALEVERSEKAVLVAELSDMKQKLSKQEASSSKAVSEIKDQKQSIKVDLTRELDAYKELAQQHAITIVALEKKLLAMMEELKPLKAENATGKEELEQKTQVIKLMMQETAKESKSAKEVISTLKNQLSIIGDDNTNKDRELEKEHQTITEMQQQMAAREGQLTTQHSKEISDLQMTMAKQEAVIESKSDEVDILTTHLSERVAQLDSTSHELTKTKEELVSIHRWIAEGTDLVVKPTRLTEAGHVCLKEKHGDIIENQKKALTQLRQKISDLELAKPPIGSHQATLKELSCVRHELARLRANGATTSASPTSSKKKPDEEMKLIPQFISESIEEGKAREVMVRKLEDTLQYSEKMYNTLVEAICQGLPEFEGSAIEPGRLAATDEATKKKEVIRARKKFADAVLKKLGSQKKEENSSDKELKRRPEEIISELEATLNETAEELEQQKRLNQALLRRKIFREAQQQFFEKKPKHSCNPVLN